MITEGILTLDSLLLARLVLEGGISWCSGLLNLDSVVRLLLVDNLGADRLLISFEQNLWKYSWVAITPILLDFIVIQIDEVLHRINRVADHAKRS